MWVAINVQCKLRKSLWVNIIYKVSGVRFQVSVNGSQRIEYREQMTDV
jgi:hypothetical protein